MFVCLFFFVLVQFEKKTLLNTNIRFEYKNKKRAFSRIYYCNVPTCNKKLDGMLHINFSHHMKKHLRTTSSVCQYCNFTVPDISVKTRVLMEHMFKNHTKMRPYCFSCLSSFHHLENYYKHIVSCEKLTLMDFEMINRM